MYRQDRSFSRLPRLLLGLVLLAGIGLYGYLFGGRVVNGVVVDAYTKRPVDTATLTVRSSTAMLQPEQSDAPDIPVSSTAQPGEAAGMLLPLQRLTEQALNERTSAGADGSFKLLSSQPMLDLPGPVLDITQKLGIRFTANPAVLVAQAPGYADSEIMIYNNATVQMQLRPNNLTGVIYEDGTNLPVANALVALGDNTTRTDSNGIFKLPNIPAQATLAISAPGYERRQMPFDRRTAIAISLKPFIAHGIYVPYYVMQSGPQTRELIDKAAAAGLNALVVDAKSERGLLSYPSEVSLAKLAKADADQDIYGLDKIVQRAHERNMYVIARICVFKDMTFATSRPDLALRDSRTGRVWFENPEAAWLDPYMAENWDYILAIAKEVAQRGVDEIQFDYIRFPGGTVPSYVHYSQNNTEQNRRVALNTFLSKARQMLLPYNVTISADVFGFTTLYPNELGIGQRIDEYGQHMDFVSPMLYPSTFGDDDPKFENPPVPTGHPYDLIKLCLDAVNKRLELNPVKIRPWLQDYPDGVYGQPFAGPQLRDEIRAADDGGAHGWLVWNPYGAYHWDVINQQIARAGN